jgi:hypothetical protein
VPRRHQPEIQHCKWAASGTSSRSAAAHGRFFCCTPWSLVLISRNCFRLQHCGLGKAELLANAGPNRGSSGDTKGTVCQQRACRPIEEVAGWFQGRVISGCLAVFLLTNWLSPKKSGFETQAAIKSGSGAAAVLREAACHIWLVVCRVGSNGPWSIPLVHKKNQLFCRIVSGALVGVISLASCGTC